MGIKCRGQNYANNNDTKVLGIMYGIVEVIKRLKCYTCGFILTSMKILSSCDLLYET